MKRTFIVAGARVYRWVVVNVADLIDRGDTKFRCKDCFGELKLQKHVAQGASPYLKHKSKEDSEFCPAGMYFQEARDGREPRKSEFPVKLMTKKPAG